MQNGKKVDKNKKKIIQFNKKKELKKCNEISRKIKKDIRFM